MPQQQHYSLPQLQQLNTESSFTQLQSVVDSDMMDCSWCMQVLHCCSCSCMMLHVMCAAHGKPRTQSPALTLTAH